MLQRWLGTIAILMLVAASGPPAFTRDACESLTSLALPHTTITSATMIPAGPLTGAPTGNVAASIEIPARCEVQATTRPTKDSEIKFAVWLPATGWNGKYRQNGNGGWAGAISYAGMVDALRRGYAVAATDDGHAAAAAPGASWAIGHPEKLIDFGYRAVHETSVQAKAIVRAFFGQDSARYYFVGCSDGGREALMEAQRYPEDFHGIVAGAPANNWTHLMAGFVWNEQALLGTSGSSIPPAKLPAIQRAALAACDRLDGVQDGLVDDPRQCHFDPSALLCTSGETDQCLTAAQLEALKRVYAGPSNSRTGTRVFPGYPPGTEAAPNAWVAWITPANPATAIQFGFGNMTYGQAVSEDARWDFREVNFDSDVDFADAKVGPVLNSTNPDLRSFQAEGGKLLQYHGWGDAAIAPLSSIDYYESVRTFSSRFPNPRVPAGSDTSNFYRLFMVPGMGHCGSGVGPNVVDWFSPLEAWVERGVAPDQIVGTGKVVGDPSKTLTRPICAYPRTARYRGTGDANDASNFVCRP